jgi:hypothetical protein
MSAENTTPTLRIPPPTTDPQFVLFGILPLELRLTIWELALPGPRIVHFEPRRVRGGTCVRVRSDKANDSAGNEAFFQHPLVTQNLYNTYYSSSNRQASAAARPGVHFGPESCWAPETFPKEIPALLLACKESHGVATKVYTQAFGTFGARASTWFSFELDTLYVDDRAMVGFETGLYNQEYLGFQFDLSRVKKLAIGGSGADISADTKYYLDWMGKFGNLRELYIINSVHNYTDDRSNVVFIDDFDINMAMDHYNDGYDYSTYLDFQDEREAEARFVADIAREDMQALRRDKRDDVRTGIPFRNFRMPIIQHKLAVTPQKKTEYEEARTVYEEEKNLDYARLNLVASGYSPLPFIVRWTTTVREMTETFRQARNIPVEKGVKLRLPGDVEDRDPEELIFTAENLDQLQLLHIFILDN